MSNSMSHLIFLLKIVVRREILRDLRRYIHVTKLTDLTIIPPAYEKRFYYIITGF